MNKKLKKILFVVLKIFIVFACFFYLYSAFSESLSTLSQDFWNSTKLVLLLEAFILYSLFFMTKVFNWWYILHLLKVNVSIPFAAGVWFGSQTIKYIPGKVWFFLGRFYLGRKKISNSDTFVATCIELVMMLLSGTLVFILCGHSEEMEKISQFIPSPILIVGLVVSFFVAIHPRVLEWGIGFLAKKTGSEKKPLHIRYGSLVLLLCIYVLNWGVFGVANYILVNAFVPIPFAAAIHVIAIFSIAYVVGFVSFITPGGIGVRESIQVYFLSGLIYSSPAVLVSVFSRIFWMLVEVLGTISFLGIRKLVRLKKESLEENK